jgi:phosphohistidine phosphatase
MDLIFWRHAEAQPAEDPGEDMLRALTPKGVKHATRAARWLSHQCPGTTKVYVSPAKRCQQTAICLDREFHTADELGPDACAEDIFAFLHWPTKANGTLLVVGHQPALGACVATLLGQPDAQIAVPKGAFWWLSSRDNDEQARMVVRAVLTPSML